MLDAIQVEKQIFVEGKAQGVGGAHGGVAEWSARFYAVVYSFCSLAQIAGVFVGGVRSGFCWLGAVLGVAKLLIRHIDVRLEFVNVLLVGRDVA